jgi:Class II flagellar assembly regulator
LKITGVGPSSTAETARIRRKDAKSSSFAKELDNGGAESTNRLTEQSPVRSLDALLALQEVPDATSGRSAGLRRGFDLLDRLDEIRMGLLAGSIPTDRLGNLLRMVRSQRDSATDPKLGAILDDIELRAMVELAKLGQYL